MGAWFGDVFDLLLPGQVVTDAPIMAVSPYPNWHQVDSIVAHLSISAAAGVGDALQVTVQESLDREHWRDLMSFTPIAGDAVMPYHETKSVVKAHDGQSAWGPFLRALASPTGLTADFRIAEVTVIGA